MMIRPLGLSYRTRNTKLLHSLNIEPIEKRDKYSKCKLMLTYNSYTKLIIDDLVNFYYDYGCFHKNTIILKNNLEFKM